MSQFTRRSILGSALAAGILGRSGVASAHTLDEAMPLIRKLLARHWSGSAWMPTPATENGKLVIGLDYDFNLDSGTRFLGKCVISSTWDSVTYRATYDILGFVEGSGTSFDLNIISTDLVKGDSLPQGLYWQGLTGRLNIYESENRPGTIFLRGMLTGTTGGDQFTTELN